VVGLVILGGALGAVVMTQGPVAEMVIGSAISSATGAQFSAHWTSIHPNGRVVATGVELRVPGIDGPGGQLVSIERLEIELDWSDVLLGAIAPTGVRMINPVIRLSQSAGGRLNVLDLPLSNAPGASTALLPRIEAIGGRVEIGEHKGTDYRELARMDINGWIAPTDQQDQYTLELRERLGPREVPGAGVVLSGSLDMRAGEGRASLNRLDLSQWTPERVPEVLRSFWRQLNIRGRITSTTFSFTRAEGIAAAIELKGVSIDLPMPADRPEFVPAPRPLSMTDVTGKITFRQAGKRSPQGGIDAELSGRVEDLPARVILNTDGLDPLDAGIECQIISEQFQIAKQPRLLPFMPELMRKRLAAFSGPTAMVDAQASIKRAPAPPADQGPPPPDRWTAEGSIRFSKGRAAFAQFPYPFFDIEGYVRFDDERVRIVSLTGRSASGAAVLATGEIWPPDEGEYTKLKIVVTDAPMDDTLAGAVGRRLDLAQAALVAATPEGLRATRAMAKSSPGAEIYPMLLGAEAMGAVGAAAKPGWSGLYQALFSRSQYDRILARGLVLDATRRRAFEESLASLRQRRAALTTDQAEPSADSAALASAIDDSIKSIEERLAAPDFALGGRIRTMTIDVDRAPDRNNGHYDTDVRIDFERAGLLPEAFPLPLNADRVDLRIRDEAMYFEAQVGRGIRGGRATVTGKIAMDTPEGSNDTPELHIKARDLGVDDLLINAIPERMARGDQTGPPDARGQRSAPELLRSLNLRGRVDCDADVFPLETGGIKLDVRVDLDGLTSFPEPRDPDRPGLAVTGLSGKIFIGGEQLRIESLTGELRSASDPMVADLLDESFVGPPWFEHEPWPARGRVRLDAQVALGLVEAGAGTSSARIAFEDLDLAQPLQDLVDVVSGNGATQIEMLRSAYNPEGFIGGEASIELKSLDGAGNERTDLIVALKNADSLAVNALGGRLSLDAILGEGEVRLAIEPNTPVQGSIRFDRVDLEARLDDDEASRLRLGGGLSFRTDPAGPSESSKMIWRTTVPLGFAVESGLLESRLFRAALGVMAPEARAGIAEVDLRGRFDADLSVSREAPAADAPWSIKGTVTPRSLGLTRRGRVLDFDQVEGTLSFSGPGGAINNVRMTRGDWWLGLNGGFSLGSSSDLGWTLDASLSASGRRLDSDFLALLPMAVAEASQAIELKVENGFEMRDARLRLAGGTGTSGPSLKIDGAVKFAGVAAQLGVPLAEGNGSVGIEVDRPAEETARASTRLDVVFDSVVAAGLSLRNARAEIASGATPDTLLAPSIYAECYGGRLTGSAVVRPVGSGASGRSYDARITLAGARFADMVDEIQARAKEAAAREFIGPLAERTEPEEATEPPSAALPGDVRRGWFDAELTLSGVVGDLPSRRGRGSLRIGGGNVIDLPLVFPLMQLSNFQLPSNERLDFVHGSFYLRGDRLVFDEFAVLAESLSVLGWGEMRLRDLGLNLRFNSRGTLQIPLWSTIVDGVRNELITTKVSGTLAEPRFQGEQFSGTRRLIDSIFGGTERIPVPDLDQAEARARAERRHFRRE